MTEKTTQEGNGQPASSSAAQERVPTLQVEQADVPGRPHAPIQKDSLVQDVDPLDEEAPPAYGEIFGHVDDEQEDLGTHADIAGL